MGNETPKKPGSEVLSFIGKIATEIRGYEEIIQNERMARQVWSEVRVELDKIGFVVDRETKILEVGSGKGALLELLNDTGHAVVGVDARPRLSSGDLPVVQARIEQLPFRDSSFDLVYASAIFDRAIYDQDTEKMYEEIARVLSPHGVYVSLNHSTRSDHTKDQIPDLFTEVSRGSDDLIIYRKTP